MQEKPGRIPLKERKKRCPKCKRRKLLLKEFYRNKSTKDGFSYRCKVCQNAASERCHDANPERHKEVGKEYYRRNAERFKANALEWGRKNPEKRRNIKLKYRYGFKAGDFEKFLAEQDGVCIACGEAFGDGWFRPVVDHDHKTGRVRGIIHQRCNVLIGSAGDSPDLLQRLVIYLAQHTSESKCPLRLNLP